MTGTQTRINTIPNPVWGASNVGTADINGAFAAQLRSGTQTLMTETINGLNPGETKTSHLPGPTPAFASLPF